MTAPGDITLKVPKFKEISFETAIIERYRRRENSVGGSLHQIYLAGVYEALWGSKVSQTTISELNKKTYIHIED